MGAAGIAGLIVLVVLLAVLATLGAQRLLRGTPVERVRTVGAGPAGELPPAADPRFAQLVGLLARAPLAAGHEVEVLANGDETFPRMWDDLRAAARSVAVQVYYARPGQVADELRGILEERARAGVAVRVLYDGFGAQELPAAYWAGLREAGAQVAAFRPLRGPAALAHLHRLQHRAHSRLVVIDGAVAYTGGFGVDDKWAGGGGRAGEWRDTNVRCAGPAARQFEAAFATLWAEATGALLAGDALVAQAAVTTSGGACAGLLFATPTLGSTDAERFLAATIVGARRTLWIANGYFAPDDDLRRLLVAAARRGVDVRILTAGADTDVKVAWYAGRGSYDALLAGGVRVYEYQPAMMHAKTLVADGRWGTVGSMSFDNRALALNVESTLLVHDAAVGARLEALFRDDLRQAREIRLDEWRRRPWRERVLEAGAAMVSRLL